MWWELPAAIFLWSMLVLIGCFILFALYLFIIWKWIK